MLNLKTNRETTMNIRELPLKLQIIAEKKVNEVAKRVPSDLNHIRSWLSLQPHLNARTDDQWLLSFLRACKFSLHKTQEKLDNYYTVRSGISEFFSNRDPYAPEIQEILKLGLFLPIDNHYGPKIFLFRHSNVLYVPLVTLIKTTLMIIDIIINEDDDCMINGQHIVIDLKGVTANNLMQLTPTICQKLAVCLKDSYPSRPQGFHIINMPPFFTSILNSASSMLGQKLGSRIVLYSKKNISKLYKTVPLSVLPSDYGGSGDSTEKLTQKWKAKVENYKDWFSEDSKYCSDESKRLTNTVTSSGLFGVEGTFRQLTVD